MNDESISKNNRGDVDVLEEDFFCRICYGGEKEGELFSPCLCRGSMRFVHVDCLEKWRDTSANPQAYFTCPNCKYNYNMNRPKIAKLLQSDGVVYSLTAATLTTIVIGSGSGVIALAREKFDLRSATYYGVILVGIYGLIPKLPTLILQFRRQHIWKFLQDTDHIIAAGLALLVFGALNAASGVYQMSHLFCKYLTRKLGERVLDVNSVNKKQLK